MSTIEKRTVSLPKEHSTYIDELVSSGSYASASEVVRAGLRALQERDVAVEKWLREEVAPMWDSAQENPQNLLSSEDVTERLKAHHKSQAAEAR